MLTRGNCYQSPIKTDRITNMPKIETIRHSLSHILAAAVWNIYPEAKFGIGPAVENGFYYDIEFPGKIAPKDLKKIEKEMKRIIKQGVSFEKEVVSKEKAKNLFKDQPYKKEIRT